MACCSFAKWNFRKMDIAHAVEPPGVDNGAAAQEPLAEESPLSGTTGLYDDFVSMLNHPSMYPTGINVHDVEGFRYRQKLFQTLRNTRAKEAAARKVHGRLGIGRDLLSVSDLAAIQGLQKEAEDMKVHVARCAELTEPMGLDMGPSVPAGWSGSDANPNHIPTTMRTLPSRSQSSVGVVSTVALTTMPFENATESLYTCPVQGDKELLAKRSADFARDTTTFRPAPVALLQHREENVAKLRKTTNIIVAQNRGLKALRKIQEAHAEALPLYKQRSSSSGKAFGPGTRTWEMVSRLVSDDQAEESTRHTLLEEVRSAIQRSSSLSKRGDEGEGERFVFPYRTINPAILDKGSPSVLRLFSGGTNVSDSAKSSTPDPSFKSPVKFSRDLPDCLCYVHEAQLSATERLGFSPAECRETERFLLTLI